MPTAFAHTCVRVRDIAASLRFYRLLGFEERGRLNFESAYNVYLGLPGGPDVLELTVNIGREDPPDRPRPHPPGPAPAGARSGRAGRSDPRRDGRGLGAWGEGDAGAAARLERRAAAGQAAAGTDSAMRNGVPQAPQTMGAWARTEGTTRTLRPQSHTALTRTPPPEEPWRAAGPRKLREVSPEVAARWALSARCNRSAVARYRRRVSAFMVTTEKPLLGCGSSAWSRPSSSATARNRRL